MVAYLLYGPPGTGKTLIAEWMHAKGGTTYFKVDCSKIKDEYLGGSEKFLTELFRQARASPTPAIIFMDEIDSLVSASAQTKWCGVVNHLKTLMQPGDPGTQDVLVIGCTNHPEEIDSAIISRIGRHHMRHIGMPDVEARKEIIKTCIYAVALSPNIDDWDEVGAASEGFAGRDIFFAMELAKKMVTTAAKQRAKFAVCDATGKLTEDGDFRTPHKEGGKMSYREAMTGGKGGEDGGSPRVAGHRLASSRGAGNLGH